MRSRPAHLLLSLTTLVVAVLVWLAPRAAFAGDAAFTFPDGQRVVCRVVRARGRAGSRALAHGAPRADRADRPRSLCDPRGATTFAPPPQMQDVEVSLDTGLTLEECLASLRDNDMKRAAPGRAPLPSTRPARPPTPRCISHPRHARRLRARAPARSGREHFVLTSRYSQHSRPTAARLKEARRASHPLGSGKSRARTALSRGVRKAASSSSRTT